MSAVTPTAEPGKRRWSRAEYYRMADLGWFDGQRVELIDGEIMVLSPQKFGHYAAVDRGAEVLRSAFGAGFWVRTQAPMNFGPSRSPSPTSPSWPAGAKTSRTTPPRRPCWWR